MKKPKNFDKLNKIKISDLPVAKFFPTVTNILNETVDITHIVIYNASPKTKKTKKDIYHKSSTIVLINEGALCKEELVIKINWNNQTAYAHNQPMGTYYDTNRATTLLANKVHTDKKFLPNQVVTMEAFLQMVILPLMIESIEKVAWILTP